MSLLRLYPALLLLATFSASACTLTEVTAAESDDVIIAEIVLRTDDTIQTAYLHRTTGPGMSPTVPGASVVVRDVTRGVDIRFAAAAESNCVEPVSQGVTGSCYVFVGDPADINDPVIRPGTRYSLRIETADGRVLTGVTDVPAKFGMIRPAPEITSSGVRLSCKLEPGTVFDLTWQQSAGASVYLVEARMPRLREALRAAGTDDEGDDAVELTGLSISAADTTLRFPSELGLFDRFDDSLFPILLAIRDGLPADVSATVVVAAADRNYVNWVRGGNFNPSGAVRVSSIRGDGRGVFGSIVAQGMTISTQTSSTRPPC